ncbi:MAG: hypothetical protein ACE5JE_02285 [Thermoplasmata archaeon]
MRRTRRVLWIVALLTVASVVIALSWYYFLDSSTPREGFLVEDPGGDRMEIRVDPSRQEARDALGEMHGTGEARWVGGEIESFENEFGFRFRPDTIVVADITAEGAQAVYYRTIQGNFTYWLAFGVVYIEGTVILTPS